MMDLIGKEGIVLSLGIMIFLFAYKYSVSIFDWIESQTYGTRNYILEKCEFLFIEVKSEHVTYALLGLSFGLGSATLLLIGTMGSWAAGVVFGILFGFLGWKIPRPFIDFLVSRRINSYQNQMVDALTLLSNGIRAGLSVPQSLSMVVDEMPAPVSQEFGVILQQSKIGVPLEECFDNLAIRVPTEDNEMFVTSINVLRETGGNLAEVFDTIVNVIRERVRLKQKIQTYIAQGLFQGLTIFCMPFLLGVMNYVSDPVLMGRMFTHPVGIGLTVVALGLDLLGGYVILKIVRIKI